MTTRGLNVHTEFLEFSREKLLEQYWPRLRCCGRIERRTSVVAAERCQQ